jgi:glycosyltransferase involved in cell wall biosynthesis
LIAVHRSPGPLRGGYDVVFFARWLGPLLTASDERSAGGAETQILLVAKGLAAAGHRVAVVVDETEPPLPDAVDGVDVIPLVARAVRPALRRASYVAAFARTMARLDTRTVVQRTAGVETLMAGLAARARGRRFVYSSSSITDFDFARRKVGRTTVALYHLGLRLADALVVQTAEQAELCRRRLGRTPHVIANVVEPAPPREAPGAAFLWIGRLAPYKGPLAYVDLARAVPEARFRMVGVPLGAGRDDALVAAVRRAAEELPNLELLAPRPRHRLAELFEEAVAVVNTSEFEGMPNALLEGWARGVPALALHYDPDGVIAARGIGGFAGGDPARLAELAREMWRSREDAGPLAARCIDYVAREHAPETVAGQWQRALGLAVRPVAVERSAPSAARA